MAQEKDGVLPVDGAADLLEALSGSPWAIVTSGDRAFVEACFAAEGLPLPAVRVYGSDVEHAKPAPDCFALAVWPVLEAIHGPRQRSARPRRSLEGSESSETPPPCATNHRRVVDAESWG
ncbi:HAD family hydrolase [Streptomyces sp. 2112.3]|uniref:HAD family hydrolase n=1 Tax=Streptomyces sp. 2112.3 TaxID=1881023 RepID=UPI00352385B3